MDTDNLINAGNELRSNGHFEVALQYYAQAIGQDPDNFSAFNNFGNVLREVGNPERAIPFLQTALEIFPENVTAKFNLAISYLSIGDYSKGWPLYECRWEYEHLKGLLPSLAKPRWAGEDLSGKTILVFTEQGHGDIIQFARFIPVLKRLGANIKIVADSNIGPLLDSSFKELDKVYLFNENFEHYDYWIMIMSIPHVLKIELADVPAPLSYLCADKNVSDTWKNILGNKSKYRVGFAYSGRKDSWINQHKSMPITSMLQIIKACPNIDWINLQTDADSDDSNLLAKHNVRMFPGFISNWRDTAGLVDNLDLVISVDTAAAHFAAAMGKPTWVPLSRYAVCWRWGTKSSTMPWYPTMKLFRQTKHADWSVPVEQIIKFLSLFKL